MYSGRGRLRYAAGYVVLDVEQSLVDYYFALLPKYLNVRRQAYAAHITVVRKDKEVIGRPAALLYRSGELLSFEYSGNIEYNFPYYFLDVYSEEIGDVRLRLGLPKYRSPFNSYHLTIGNIKQNEQVSSN